MRKYCKNCGYFTDDDTNKFCPKCGKSLCKPNLKSEKEMTYNYLKKIIEGTTARIQRHTNKSLGYVLFNDRNDNLQIINNIISASNRPQYLEFYVYLYNCRFKPNVRLVIKTTGLMEGYYNDSFDTDLTPELLQSLINSGISIDNIICTINEQVNDFSTKIEEYTKNLPLWKDLQNLIQKDKCE